MGASPIIAPPQSALSPPQKRPAAQPSTARPQSRKSPKILQILLQTIRPFPRRKKDPPPNHQPLARNPENLPKSLQILLQTIRPFPAAKKTRRPTINRSPAILKIPQNPANPASDNPPFPRRKKDPPPNHQPLARNPENPPNPANPASDNLPFPPPQKRPAAQPSTARPQSRKSPQILQILLQTIRPFPRRKKDPPPNHQPLARNPENLPKSCKSCFRQSALSPAAKKTRRPTINRSPAIPKIPQNPANPASDNIHPNSGMHPSSLSILTPCLL